MSQRFYPTVSDEQVMKLNAIVLNIEKDPNYLNHPDCPYSEPVKSFFRKSSPLTANIDLFEGEDQVANLDKQIQKIINDLEAFAQTLGNADHSEKLQYFKTKTVLVDRLMTMQERVLNLKDLTEFRMSILAFLDEICTKDQITDLMKRLDGVFGANKDDQA